MADDLGRKRAQIRAARAYFAANPHLRRAPQSVALTCFFKSEEGRQFVDIYTWDMIDLQARCESDRPMPGQKSQVYEMLRVA